MFSNKTRTSLAILVAGLLIASVPSRAQDRPQTPLRPSDRANFPAPEDVAAPPENATRTASGLAWKPLGEPAARPARPGPLDLVDVRYTGWTTDGSLFDTTEDQKKPRKFRVDGAIPGFGEAVKLLSVGESGRFWVPEELAYPNSRDKPQGMLVFDLTLVKIYKGPERPSHLAAPPEDAVRLDSGLAWIVLEEGDSNQEPPGERSSVLIDYSSWTTKGELVDSTLHRGVPRTLTMNLVITGFKETFRTMVPGERRLIWIPPDLTEFDGRRTVDEVIVFDLKLHSYMNPPMTPPSVSAIPDDAERSVTGLAWRVLKPGTSDVHPREGDTVEVLYAMWTRDGQLADSSYGHASPGRFKLDHMMPIGFTEALVDMVIGEKRLTWIPEDIAYGGQENRPQGMLVFELELLSVEPGQVDGNAKTP